MKRMVSAAGALVAAALLVGLTPGTAQAAPAKPAVIHIEGADVSGTIVVTQQEQQRLFGSLLSEVNWMSTAKGQTGVPTAGKLGPKFTLTVLSKTQPMQVYELYPLAAGGPRAHRPADQPSGPKPEGWFYGRLTMSETLRISGVPLTAKPDVMNGGIGGGIGEDLAAEGLDPAAEMDLLLSDMRRLLLFNGAVLMVILTGLAGIAFLIRRKV